MVLQRGQIGRRFWWLRGGARLIIIIVIIAIRVVVIRRRSIDGKQKFTNNRHPYVKIFHHIKNNKLKIDNINLLSKQLLPYKSSILNVGYSSLID